MEATSVGGDGDQGGGGDGVVMMTSASGTAAARGDGGGGGGCGVNRRRVRESDIDDRIDRSEGNNFGFTGKVFRRRHRGGRRRPAGGRRRWSNLGERVLLKGVCVYL
nr:hypothetical protein [Tanacetum cinerariifolium]